MKKILADFCSYSEARDLPKWILKALDFLTIKKPRQIFCVCGILIFCIGVVLEIWMLSIKSSFMSLLFAGCLIFIGILLCATGIVLFEVSQYACEKK